MTNFGQLLRQTPALISSAIDYYRYEPLQPSWDLKIHLIFHFIKNMAGSSTKQTIEQRQKEGSVATNVINKSVQVDVLSLPNTLREKTASYIDKILEDYNNVILDDWRNTNLGNGLNCEWVYVKDDNNNNNGNGNDLNKKKKHEKVILFLHGGAYYLFSAAYYREKTSRLAVSTNARILAIDYRLAPQNQFPAALHDAITAYNYLVDPPKDADFEPIDPKKIVIMGDSAGGGLAIATALALRDLKLPLPGGIVTWSPWVDLASTMPSTLDPKFHKTDFIGFLTEKGHSHKMSPAWKEFEQKANELSEKIKKTQSDSNNKKQKFWHDSFDHDGHMLFYASNEGLAIPYVSPLFAESLCDLPPILMQTGDGEVFRDENIYFAFKATNPEKYNLPYYNAEKFKKSPYKTTPKVIFEIYEEMFHVFQTIPGYASPELAFKRTGDFINQILEGKGPQESKYFHVTFKGEVIEGLSEEHYKVLEWKNVGIMDVKKKASAPT